MYPKETGCGHEGCKERA